MRSFKLGSAVALAVVLLVSACGSATNNPSESPTSSTSNSPAVSDSATPSPTEVSPTPTTSPGERKTAAIYFVGDTAQGFRLYREFRKVPVELGSTTALASLKFIVAQGTKASDRDYTNLWGNGSVINSITQTGSVAMVDITIASLNVGAESEMRAIDQLVWSLTANDKTVKSVKFISSGKPLETFAGHVDATGTFSRQPTYEVLAPIWVTTPAAVVSGPVSMTGTACTFEAGVAWTLTKSGSVVKQGSTTAAQACPVRSAWKVSLGTLSPGKYVFTAIDYSAKDGSVTQQDSKTFTVK